MLQMLLVVLLGALLVVSDAASTTCYGDIMKLKPKGKANGGVAASIRDVKYDLPLLKKMKHCYRKVAEENCIQASVIAAIASRASMGGRILQKTGGIWYGGAWGIMQCDVSSGLDCTSCPWNSCCHIRMMVSMLLIPYIIRVRTMHPDWRDEQTLQGGVAAYNFGPENVWTWERLDVGTTFNDYSNDVIARAQYLHQHGWDSQLKEKKGSASRTCHGNANHLHPTGQRNGGVSASQADVQHDLPYLQKHRTCYQQAADNNCIQASVIAALASRESRGGSLLENTGGYGDGGRAWGILQCDLISSGLNCKQCGWNSCCHIGMMVSKLLVPYINQVKAKHPSWSQDQALQGGVAAYNFGVSNVQSWGGLDIGSTHNDYSNDVIARAKYLLAHGWN